MSITFKMKLISFFTENGSPKTGLTPTMDVWETDGTQAVTAQTMTEIAGGFYFYEFGGCDETKDYSIRADGGSSLPINERYKVTTNETGGVPDILKILKNKLEIKNNQLIIYDDDGTVLRTSNIFDRSGSPTEKNIYKRTPV